MDSYSSNKQRAIPLPELARALRELTGRAAPSYCALWHAVASGVISPPFERVGRYWFVAETRLGEVADRLGMTTSARGAGR